MSIILPVLKLRKVRLAAPGAAGAILLAAGAGVPLPAHGDIQAADAVSAKVLLRFKAEAGRTERIKQTGVLTVAIGGNPATLNFNVVDVDKESFTKVDAATGDVTREIRTEYDEMKMADGSNVTVEQSKGFATIVTHSNNTLVSIESSEPQGNDEQSNRASQGSLVVFADTPVTVGDTWSHEYKADAALKTPDAHADFEVVGAATIGGAQAFKIKMTYKESGPNPISSSGIHVIETASGDEISSDFTLYGSVMDSKPVTTKMRSQRIEGGPLAGSKN